MRGSFSLVCWHELKFILIFTLCHFSVVALATDSAWAHPAGSKQMSPERGGSFIAKKLVHKLMQHPRTTTGNPDKFSQLYIIYKSSMIDAMSRGSKSPSLISFIRLQTTFCSLPLIEVLTVIAFWVTRVESRVASPHQMVSLTFTITTWFNLTAIRISTQWHVYSHRRQAWEISESISHAKTILNY